MALCQIERMVKFELYYCLDLPPFHTDIAVEICELEVSDLLTLGNSTKLAVTIETVLIEISRGFVVSGRSKNVC